VLLVPTEKVVSMIKTLRFLFSSHSRKPGLLPAEIRRRKLERILPSKAEVEATNKIIGLLYPKDEPPEQEPEPERIVVNGSIGAWPKSEPRKDGEPLVLAKEGEDTPHQPTTARTTGEADSAFVSVSPHSWQGTL
jgi:hypothetical protein